MATHGVPLAVPMGSCCMDLEGLLPILGLVYFNAGVNREKSGPVARLPHWQLSRPSCTLPCPDREARGGRSWKLG